MATPRNPSSAGWILTNPFDRLRDRPASCAHDLRNRVSPHPVSAQEERHALTPPTALYDHVLHLLRDSPGGVPSWRGYSLPQKTATSAGSSSREEVESAIREALSPLPDDPATLHRRFERLGIQDRHRHLINSVVAGLPLPAERLDAARTLGRRLIRTGTTAPTVTAGIALLGRLGGPEDVPHLSALGLFRDLTGIAVKALEVDPGASGDDSLLAVSRIGRRPQPADARPFRCRQHPVGGEGEAAAYAAASPAADLPRRMGLRRIDRPGHPRLAGRVSVRRHRPEERPDRPLGRAARLAVPPVHQSWQAASVRSLTTLSLPGADDVVLVSGASAGIICFHGLASGEQRWEPVRERPRCSADRDGPPRAFSSGRSGSAASVRRRTCACPAARTRLFARRLPRGGRQFPAGHRRQ